MGIEFKDHKEAFTKAINSGIFSENKSEKNSAHNFMYMYSVGDVDYFKHWQSRKYGYDKETIMAATIFE